jgi:hypothetical protein
MRNPVCVLLFALMAALAWTTPARGEDRFLVLLFGPTSVEPARAYAVFQPSAGTNFRILFSIPELTTGPKIVSCL